MLQAHSRTQISVKSYPCDLILRYTVLLFSYLKNPMVLNDSFPKVWFIELAMLRTALEEQYKGQVQHEKHLMECGSFRKVLRPSPTLYSIYQR